LGESDQKYFIGTRC